MVDTLAEAKIFPPVVSIDGLRSLENYQSRTEVVFLAEHVHLLLLPLDDRVLPWAHLPTLSTPFELGNDTVDLFVALAQSKDHRLVRADIGSDLSGEHLIVRLEKDRDRLARCA